MNKTRFMTLNKQFLRKYVTHKENPNGFKGSNGNPKISNFNKFKSMASFSFSTIVVFGAVGITGLGIYAIGQELFSSSGDTKLFNRSVNLIQNNLYCQKLLQCETSSEKLSANHLGNGAPSRFADNSWGNRNHPVTSSKRVDNKTGNIHYYMQYHVESKNKEGLVYLQAIKNKETKKVDIHTLLLNVGSETFYVVDKSGRSNLKLRMGLGGGKYSFLGYNWSK